MTWQDSAVCATAEDPDLWFREEDADKAADVCRGCPVIKVCANINSREPTGTWGGVWRDQEEERRQRGAARIDLIETRLQAGVDPADIAAELGISVHGVSRWLYRHDHVDLGRFFTVAAFAAKARTDPEAGSRKYRRLVSDPEKRRQMLARKSRYGRTLRGAA